LLLSSSASCAVVGACLENQTLFVEWIIVVLPVFVKRKGHPALGTGSP
jgi:hypothetical protein